MTSAIGDVGQVPSVGGLGSRVITTDDPKQSSHPRWYQAAMAADVQTMEDVGFCVRMNSGTTDRTRRVEPSRGLSTIIDGHPRQKTNPTRPTGRTMPAMRFDTGLSMRGGLPTLASMRLRRRSEDSRRR